MDEISSSTGESALLTSLVIVDIILPTNASAAQIGILETAPTN